MIHLDTSVVLARLFAEDRSPPDGFWSRTLVASMDFMRSRGLSIALATYDQRLAQAAIGLGFALADC